MPDTRFGSAVGSGQTAQRAVRNSIDRACDGVVDPSSVEFIAIFASATYDQQAVVDTARGLTDNATLIGASSAGEFTDDGAQRESVVSIVLASETMDYHVGIADGLSDDAEAAVGAAMADLPDDGEFTYDHLAGLNFHDGLVGRGEEVAMLSYQHLPISYSGGSAGDDRALEATYVYANDTVTTDGVAVGVLESATPFSRGVGHGHEPLSEGYQITDAEGSVVETLGDRPAFDVWTDAVRDHAAEHLDVDVDALDPDDPEFVELLTLYEFGVETSGGEYKIRWPGLTPDTDGALHFATKMPEGTEVSVMYSDQASQQDTQRRVGREVATDGEGDEYVGALAFDCICQADILDESFGDGVVSMAEELGVPLGGMEVYGEVALNEDDMRGYHNATTSVLQIPK